MNGGSILLTLKPGDTITDFYLIVTVIPSNYSLKGNNQACRERDVHSSQKKEREMSIVALLISSSTHVVTVLIRDFLLKRAV